MAVTVVIFPYFSTALDKKYFPWHNSPRMREHEEIFLLRCQNKSVKYISKKTGISKEEIEREITINIRETDDFIRNIIKGHGPVKSFQNWEIGSVCSRIMEMSLEEITENQNIVDYICLKASDHHDRYMDCIRYGIRRNLIK